MIHLLSSEWLRTKRTAVRWIVFCLPVAFAALIIAYMMLRDAPTQQFAFQVFFEAWTAFIIPLGVGVIPAFIVHEEELAGGFCGFLSTDTPRYKLYMGKFILLFLFLSISTLIATFAFCTGIRVSIPGGVSNIMFMAAAILVIFATLPLLALHLWVSFAWGMGASIGVSISGLLLAALVGTTSLGDKIWLFIPWAWPSRLAKLPGTYLELSAGMMAPPEAISSGLVFRELTQGTIAVTVCFVVALAGGIIWFNRWESRKCYE